MRVQTARRRGKLMYGSKKILRTLRSAGPAALESSAAAFHGTRRIAPGPANKGGNGAAR